ncbi:alpha-2-macroglobulin family protein [Ferruginibacter albus]|uniref:alpha-2-macroglobulin family protein n=1 Tax=Ferruginibacter albus TaxID=2875540 RepID=UPI001CC568A3|nr:alpha-2-macroglobulin family protein [Ferruginibacter albus]UAY52690.1 alpha-2-macroglobulin [Ferruginibacter albus]
MITKRILLAVLLLTATHTIIAQQKDYAANWKKVDQLEKKGLTKSALQEVQKIYALAVKENNDVQQVKACIYQANYKTALQEGSAQSNIFYFDTLVSKAKVPAKNILQSIQAQLYWQFLQNNRYKFYNRTQLQTENSKDITTWSIEKLSATIATLYKQSLTNETILKKININTYDAIVVKGQNTLKLRPSLYDFLAFRALDYFNNDERSVTKPAYEFTIDDEAYFKPAIEFTGSHFQTKDSSSLYFNAILLLQDILKFHLSDASPSALIDADILRLNFVHDKAVMENKDELFEGALRSIETKYPNDSVTAQAMYLRAALYYQHGQKFEPLTNTKDQYEIKRAKELCETIVQKFPKSEGGINAKNLLSSITEPSLKLTSEQVNIPSQPFRNLVSYKNINTLYVRIIKTSREEIKKLDRNDAKKYWTNITKLKPIKEWNIALPNLQDYQQHSTEIKADGLEDGVYFILASQQPDFSLTKNVLSKQVVYVSNISFIHTDNDYYILNRDSGEPLSNAQVQVWESKYNYTTYQYDQTKAEKYTTDKNGHFKLRNSKDYRNILLQIIAGNDELFLDNEMNSNSVYNSYAKETAKPFGFLFTDRSIYRPGQTVYFKSIFASTDSVTKKTSTVQGFNTTILLMDANFQKAASLSVTTNEFGSCNGKFVLPQGLLTGQFSIRDSITGSNVYFNVEEYKRPKFSVDIPKPKATYRLNDSITVTGTAKAYAGNNIDGAKVSYRVVRRVQYPIWWDYGFSFRKTIYNNSDEMEITNGETTTDEKGEFTVHFKAIPDKSVDKKDEPIFYYDVTADITDNNGETRSGNTSVGVSYQTLQLNINVADKIALDSFKQATIKSTNINDIEENAAVSFTIEKLRSPGKIFRERYWNEPDQFVMSKDEYYGYFPYDIYKNENEIKNYDVQNKVYGITDSTNRKLIIDNKQFSTGYYKLTATTKDKYGEDVKTIKYIQLTSINTSTENSIEINNDKPTAEPGDKVNYSVNTGFDKIWTIQYACKMNRDTLITYPIIGQNKPLQFTIPITENDRGGIGLSIAFVKHNRVYSSVNNLSIPWSNKDLNISFNTFRDKLLPGANEKWSVKISGNKNEKVAAEMLTAMYDASLDQFNLHSWYKPNVWPSLYFIINWSKDGFNDAESQDYNTYSYISYDYPKSYDYMFGFEDAPLKSVPYFYFNSSKFQYKGDYSADESVAERPTGNFTNALLKGRVSGVNMKSPKPKFDDADGDGIVDQLDKTISQSKQINTTNPDNIQIRKNFNETAFFFPDLKTDAQGNVEFSFTIPEALTQWKLMTLAHTKDMASGYIERTLVTQKQLMIQPNAPRFLREGDKIEFSAKVVNLSDSIITGNAQLELIDATTDQPVDISFANKTTLQDFTVPAGQSIAVKFPITIPVNFNSALTYRVVAKANKVSDGEENTIPVLTNRTLVTESLPLNLRNTNKKDFKFEKLLNSGSSKTLTNQSLTIEFTSNPVWYAVQALPYLMEYPYECAEQTFNRYYANTLASYVSNSTPKIKAVFEKWKTIDTAALQSNLEKNEELKSALLQETPWVLDAQNEDQQKKNIALLFDMVKMSSETQKAIDKLKELQSSNGGFVWFKDGPDDRYITQYIVAGIGHLKKLNAVQLSQNKDLSVIILKAIPYLDKKIKEDYDNLIKSKVRLSNNNLSSIAIDYLYMRSFFPEYKIAAASQIAYNYYKSQAQKYWLNNSKYTQAMIALSLNRANDNITSKAIIKSLKENSITNEEMGMYWKEWNTGGYYWYQAPIESQALMIEAFTEIDKTQVTIDDLKTWLLKQKQTQNWKTTKATSEACYALLLTGSKWLNEEKTVTIHLGDTTIQTDPKNTEAGTGYFKTKITGNIIKPEMGNISVAVSPASSTSSGAWGSVYWQYFEDLDKITSAETPLKLSKKLFIERNSDTGPVLIAITDSTSLKVGDKIKVRIELRVDRDMEYVHMKDMRASCMEPVNVLSEYKWQDGLGYYESTKDASTNFFFSQLYKGTYVFEYPLFVTHSGNFSNGITTIQCMYAPEFTAHSEGVRVNVTP